MSQEKKREVVVVTGGSAGCGRAIAEEFGRHKAAVAILARGKERLQDSVLEVMRLGGEAIAIPTDVAEAEAVERAAVQIEEQLGPIDIWIKRAMASMVSELIDMTPDEFRRVTEVTSRFCVGDNDGFKKNAATRQRNDYTGRKCPGIPQYTSAICLLQCEISDPGIYRFAA